MSWLARLFGRRRQSGSIILKAQPIRLSPQERGEQWELAGLEFEKFIITRFDPQAYRLLDWRGDKYIDGYGGPESSSDPDVLFMRRKDKDRFAIECKYRSKWWHRNDHGDCIEWARVDQLKQYQSYQHRRGIPVYVAIGVGGVPAQPAELFIGRIDEVKFRTARKYHLDQFRQPADIPWGGLEFA